MVLILAIKIVGWGMSKLCQNYVKILGKIGLRQNLVKIGGKIGGKIGVKIGGKIYVKIGRQNFTSKSGSNWVHIRPRTRLPILVKLRNRSRFPYGCRFCHDFTTRGGRDFYSHSGPGVPDRVKICELGSREIAHPKTQTAVAADTSAHP